jgi:hypothetical protein
MDLDQAAMLLLFSVPASGILFFNRSAGVSDPGKEKEEGCILPSGTF